jgi:hypothetical protein
MGKVKFATKCKEKGIDLAAANTTAEEVVETYRNNYPAIAGTRTSPGCWREGGLWKNLERAARRAINGYGPVEAGKCIFSFAQGNLTIRLPSGRPIVYRNARLEPQGNGERPAIVFDSPKRPNEKTYGGKLAENVVSGICRDLLVAAIIECERQNLPVVMHVHDENVLEMPAERADESLRQLLRIMSTPPAWAAGFPIEVEGFYAERYYKSPPAGSRSIRARNGEILPSERKD